MPMKVTPIVVCAFCTVIICSVEALQRADTNQKFAIVQGDGSFSIGEKSFAVADQSMEAIGDYGYSRRQYEVRWRKRHFRRQVGGGSSAHIVANDDQEEYPIVSSVLQSLLRAGKGRGVGGNVGHAGPRQRKVRGPTKGKQATRGQRPKATTKGKEGRLGSRLRSRLRSNPKGERSRLGSRLRSRLGSRLRSRLGGRLGSRLRGRLGSWWGIFFQASRRPPRLAQLEQEDGDSISSRMSMN